MDSRDILYTLATAALMKEAAGLAPSHQVQDLNRSIQALTKQMKVQTPEPPTWKDTAKSVLGHGAALGALAVAGHALRRGSLSGLSRSFRPRKLVLDAVEMAREAIKGALSGKVFG